MITPSPLIGVVASDALAAIAAAAPADVQIVDTRQRASQPGALEQLFAAERFIAQAYSHERAVKTRNRIGRHDIAERRAADKRRHQAKKAARRLKEQRK